MSFRRPARWLSLLANVGALIGLLLIVVQLGQNRDLMRAQIRHDLAMGIVELLNAPAANSQLASVLRRGELGEQLTADEQFQFNVRSNALLRYWEDVHYQYRQGMFDDDEYQKHLATVTSVISRNNGLLVYWCTYKSMYSVPFGNDMDSLLGSDACD